MDPIFLHMVQEAEDAERQNQLRLERRIFRDEQNAFELPEREFRKCFRLSRQLVQDLIRDLTPHMDAGIRATRVPIHIRILGALRFFAQGSYQKAGGNEMHVALSQPAFSRALSEVCLALEAISHRWIKFPLNEAEKQEKKKSLWPRVIGCIDGTHIAIVVPRENEHLYFNRKQYQSKNVQLICDANLVILNVKSNYGGATHDAFIWRNSNIKAHLEQMYNHGDHNSWLLGDSGYPQEPWLMTPIQGVPRDTPEGRYTAALTSTRNCVERCIGVLKNRFRCLLKDRVLHYDPFKAGQIINAVSVLHNMCVRANLAIEYDEEEQRNDEDVPDVDAAVIARNVLVQGQARRANIIQLYFQNI
ncbi:hypothetical protein NQ315_003266 [Exocentrus adspersus]|uniref:DDE Tnp4 domain-containing protein n=1 Tax=Exocentrus adspersus TaxID=1586481 RepID=A0AAV8VCK1_9CUCU|nr:hypothetical protein NQ315_003266 [Exocentrus adspersus]